MFKNYVYASKITLRRRRKGDREGEMYTYLKCRIAVDGKGKCSLVGSVCTLAH